MTTKIGIWILAVWSLATCLGFVGWTYASNQFPAEEARLYPFSVARHIADQLSQAEPVTDWNFPLWSIVVWVAWLMGIHGWGLLIRRWMKAGDSDEPPAWTFVLDFAVGFVAVAMAQLLLGLIGFAKMPLIPVFAVIGCLAFFQYRNDALRFPKALVWNWKRLGRLSRLPVIICMVAIVVLLVPALVPPIQSDGLRYHLGAVQEFLKLGRIAYLPSNAYSNMPFLVEMHFMAALACRAPESSQLIHFTLAVLTSLAIYTLGRRWSGGSRALPLAAGALYLFTPMSAILAGWPFTDHAISFFLLVSIMAAMQTIDRPVSRNWMVLGIILGGLLGTKYTMGPVGVAILLLPVISGTSQRPGKITLAALTMGIVGGVWYLKNLLFTWNPFYPLATKWFGGGEWTSEANAFLAEKAGVKGLGKSAQNLLTSPWDATFQWTRFEAHNPGPTILLTFAGVIVTSVLLCRKDKFIRWVIALLGMIYAIWFFSYQSNRLLLPFLALALAVSSAAPIGRVKARNIYLLSFGIASGYGFLWAAQWALVVTGLSPSPLPYLLGAIDEKTFRYKSVTYARAFDYLNENVASEEKVLLVGEHRIYGAKFSAIWSDWFDTPILAHILRKEKLGSTTELLSYLRANDINWILINGPELSRMQGKDFQGRFSAGEWQIFEELDSINSPEIKVITLPPGVKILQLGSPE